MPDDSNFMRQFAVYYAGGIVIAAVVFRVTRAWLKSRRNRREESL